ncbi:MAG: transketolase [Alphaproteobacteria bacterium]
MSTAPRATPDATTTTPRSAVSDHDIMCLDLLERRLRWLSTWTIHHANHVRESRDGLKVGGHQASCASMTSIMAALYFNVLNPADRVAVKPHASPVFHAVQYLLGHQTADQLQRFRALGGAQSYPSRTKDVDDVDFSTGSVGLGVAISAFASLAQDYLEGQGWRGPMDRGRMISLLGDAELDEGNIYEALLECAKHDIRNTWWIVDYNRQSLDAVTPERMIDRYEGIFTATGWRVVPIRWGRMLQAAFEEPGGEDLRRWITRCPNDLYAALAYEGGTAWRDALRQDLHPDSLIWPLINGLGDDRLHTLMTNLGGHCLRTLLDVFNSVPDDAPHLFVCYTIKGYGLPFQGHKDNHAGLMTPDQMSVYRTQMNVPEGREWEPFAGLSDTERRHVEAFLDAVPFAAERDRRRPAADVSIPGRFDTAFPETLSTQAAFGRILHDIARSDTDLARRIVTTSPDVTVSTNLGPWVNTRGIFARKERPDVFRDRKIASPQRWRAAPDGQHIELGIAENNLFILLAALGLTGPLFGERLLPIGTLYDPFIARGLDALNYACYQDARFLLVATPSGITLGPEGGAHQSVSTPLIGMGQPGLTYFEPAFAHELATIMAWAFDHMQAEDGGSVYLRLSTRPLVQPSIGPDPAREAGIVEGAYWLRPPAPGADLAIAACGALLPEAIEAHDALMEDAPGAGLLAVTSPDRLYTNWRTAQEGRWTGAGPAQSTIARLLSPLAPHAALVTVQDGSPQALTWLGAVRGQKVASLGLDRFGQTGNLPDLYRTYRLDAEAILDACAGALLGSR